MGLCGRLAERGFCCSPLIGWVNGFSSAGVANWGLTLEGLAPFFQQRPEIAPQLPLSDPASANYVAQI